ncbi:11504_t:CDS:1, partial [Gigaspora rosea]
PSAVLDESITSAIIDRDEVIKRNNALRKQNKPPKHELHFISKRA